MLVSDYNYNLPDECIASEPPKVRGTTRLLALNRETGEITDSHYADLADFLEPGDLLILNDTRVMRSRVFTELPDGRPRELVVLERHSSNLDHVMYRGKLHNGDKLTVINHDTNEKTEIVITIKEILGNGTAIAECDTPLDQVAEQFGNVPLPPYMHRDATKADIERYQTLYAHIRGSVAAPTAGLHFTEDVLTRIRAKGIDTETVCLHVGAGTFLPVKSSLVSAAIKSKSTICILSGSIFQPKPFPQSNQQKSLVTASLP